LDSIPETDKRLPDNASTHNNNENRRRDYSTSSQTHSCEKCITLNPSINDMTDDRNLNFLGENKHDILVGGMERSAKNTNKNNNYPYYPITYYPP
jgi:hypothetical protein